MFGFMVPVHKRNTNTLINQFNKSRNVRNELERRNRSGNMTNKQKASYKTRKAAYNTRFKNKYLRMKIATGY